MFFYFTPNRQLNKKNVRNTFFKFKYKILNDHVLLRQLNLIFFSLCICAFQPRANANVLNVQNNMF